MLLSFSQRDEAKDLLTFLPVAENIPGFAQIDSSPIVHNANVSGATVWGGEAGGVSHPLTIQPASRAQVVPRLWSAQPEGKNSGKSWVVGLENCRWNEQSPQGHSGSTCPASTSVASHFAKGVFKECLSSFCSWKEPERDRQSDPLF